MNVDDLLRHVVNDGVLNVGDEWAADDLEEVRAALCGPRMTKLLTDLSCMTGQQRPPKNLMIYCVERVLERARRVSCDYHDVVDECAARKAGSPDEVAREFSVHYKLMECRAGQFVLFAVAEVAADPATLLAAYNEWLKSKYDRVFHSDNGVQSITSHSVAVPCGDLNRDTCEAVARAMDSNRGVSYGDYEYAQPMPDVSILYSVTMFSVKIVFFSVNTSDSVPSFSLCFFCNPNIANNRMLSS